MSSAQERAQSLAREIKDAMKSIKAAEIRVQQLSHELTQALDDVRAETEAALTIVEYPTGRYECASCGLNTLFTEPTRELPACENCGNRHYVGHEPVITKIEAPAPKRFQVGMYLCARCGTRTVVATESDELSPCEVCDSTEFKPI